MNLRRIYKYLPWVCKKGIWKLSLAFLLLTTMIFICHTGHGTPNLLSTACEPMDVVYTWVNGSDPWFNKAISKYNVSYNINRYDDKNELKYSLRSLEKYAPWIRHVYIVTNGQIPGWLDLSNNRVSIITHDFLTPNIEWLPVFSSASIETFIHRIPNLSKRFLYLNDDIFLGSHLYPEDLYTDSEGTRIFQAWLVPECFQNCPWTYIGDKTCDHHCNVPECQYDGGDCVYEGRSATRRGLLYTLERNEPNPKPLQNNQIFRNKNAVITANNFWNILSGYNLTHKLDIKTLVDSFNKRHKYNKRPKTPFIQSPTKKIKYIPNISDDFSQSLIYTHMILNHRYGFKPRHVISHVGFLLEKPIIEAMHKVFFQEIMITASHRFRSPSDVQFAFLYYSYLMEKTYVETVDKIFDEFDTDKSHTWSDREIRTFLTKIFPLPLDWSAVRFFEDVIQNCSLSSEYGSGSVDKNQHTTTLYERYEDSHLPTITKNLVTKCIPLVEALKSNFGKRPKYKYKINSRRNVFNNFMMLTSNVTDVVDGLDRIRRNTRKFNCINDNLDPRYNEENELIRNLLEDFYVSLFPHRSQFELNHQYRNRFDNWRDYVKWHWQQRILYVFIYGSCMMLIFYIIHSIFQHKTKSYLKS
ncbi:N-acetylglucosamine-1-phosphate transferase subunits alpha and beta [Musca autumnalis]|uniref:N-acetylglucosamine-1-phosphate transferase subunits alpha and beta n=1 Tax=Musca autumnalis TaxID=221902 RepID=UPI003CF8034F